MLSELVHQMKASHCSLDYSPTRLFKDVFDSVGPSFMALINLCLRTGSVPDAFKKVIVQPLLKKSNLDPLVFSNFKPVSKLSFMSKVLEKIVFIQLQSFLAGNGIEEQFQSGFKSKHSTESALLKISNDILLARDTGDSVLLVLLYLTAAFDTVDHEILLSPLEQCVGIQGTVLNWFRSYLTNRSFTVNIGSCSSSSTILSCGVPQGSVLGPILFSLCMLPLGSVLRKHGFCFYRYADGIQIYLPLKATRGMSLQPLFDCLTDLKSWLALNFLNVNENKTECVLFGDLVNLTSSDQGLGP
uniref:Reverse transcriptase domain-containing protein n=1 Tax=Monopterus albus TaxID=43700 RepID=A0A3Q3K1Z7_MONAL